ncbi:head GIN domain-containing protein [Parapedobacter sp. DT-150]|uniref:head GIN domain-containing protein n=1 Tax=Parapedobacter sp. DT-150 TaxID=3396162 RepID=UPI003F1C76D3
MKRKLSSLGWLALLLPFFGIGLVHAASGASFRDEVRDVSGFHALANSGSIHVEVAFGSSESVRLEGDEAAIREIETIVKDGTLKIGFKKDAWRQNFGKVTAYVTAKRLDAVAQSGSGHITISGTVSGKELSASVSGSGRISFSAAVDAVNAAISGSGHIVANGKASESNVSLSGSGRFEGAELNSQTANLNVSGSGNISIHVTEQLDAAISGSGNINYSGEAHTNVRTSGSGKLRKL